jgi:hypothetical protein
VLRLAWLLAQVSQPEQVKVPGQQPGQVLVQVLGSARRLVPVREQGLVLEPAPVLARAQAWELAQVLAQAREQAPALAWALAPAQVRVWAAARPLAREPVQEPVQEPPRVSAPEREQVSE